MTRGRGNPPLRLGPLLGGAVDEAALRAELPPLSDQDEPKDEIGENRIVHVLVRSRVPGTNDEFSSDDPTLRPGHSVVVEAEGGSDVAVVLSTKSADSHLARRVLRRLGEADWDAREKLENREAEALAYARSRVDALGLEMKIVSSQLTLAGTRLTLFFTGEERVDFRALVRDLAARFHTRIELRQIGVRDAARHTGGTGVCGRELCCSTFLPSFEPISIRMAKDQNLALQHEKLAGYCGRLRCCLQYEHGIYRDARKALPKLGKRVKTPNGDGRLKDVDVLKGRVRVQLDGGGFGEFDSGELGIPEEILQQQQRQREAEQERAESGGESKSAKRRRRRKKKKEDG